MRIANDIIRFCAVIVGLGLIFAWLGVYNTAALPFFQRFVFWTSTMVVGGVATAIVSPLVWSDRFESVPSIFKIGAIAAIISVPVTLTLLLFFSVDPWSPSRYAIQYTYVLVISLIVTTGSHVAEVMMDKQRGRDADPEADLVQRFLERLPVKYRNADLYAISSEDHYLRVHTSLGEELILMRLADALRELGSADGLQVHRSWWVAKAGVREEKRVQGRSLLVLPSEIEVPVSRSYRAEAKAAGIIR